jgi:dTDP-4-dehydrorhamnose 3,5-epimerase
MSKLVKSINGIKIMKLEFYEDDRGTFYEVYNKKQFLNHGIKDNFVQNSISVSKKNVLRGMHYTIKNPQSQLLTVIQGEIYDCLVDLRKKSKYFGKFFSFNLNSKKINQIYMPPGIAHGFCVLSKKAILQYNSSKVYNPNNEGGLIWNDKKIKIDWPIKKPIISKKDKTFNSFKEIINLNQLPNL